MTVVDSGVVGTALLDITSPAAEAMAEGDEMAAPPIMWLEVLNRLRRHTHHGELPKPAAETLMERLEALPIEQYHEPRLLRRMWELCSNLTPYDASYVALAEHLSGTLLTGDERLSRAPGLRCPVQIVARVAQGG